MTTISTHIHGVLLGEVGIFYRTSACYTGTVQYCFNNSVHLSVHLSMPVPYLNKWTHSQFLTVWYWHH